MPLKLAVTPHEKELQAHFIDALANDYYMEALHGLPNGEPHRTDRRTWDLSECDGYNLYNTMDKIHQDSWAGIGRAIRDNNTDEVGRLVIKAVTDVLREEAMERAEESLP